MTNEIPPYQAIDIIGAYILGNHKTKFKPVPGWVIEVPDQRARDKARSIDEYYVFAYSEQEAEGKVRYIKSVSEYPNHVYADKCWIHNDGTRKYRTPR